jgi:geranylgeranyl transferase type-2 subunit alpha
MWIPETASLYGSVRSFADACIVHAWNYRRYVLSGMPIRKPDSAELAYTKKKIESNFSNFSAWHQRSKVLARMWQNNELDSRKSKALGEQYLS